LRQRYKQLAALGILNPKELIGPARLTPLASTSARGQDFASELRRHGVEVSNIPVEENQPGEFFWLDALIWQPLGEPSAPPPMDHLPVELDPAAVERVTADDREWFRARPLARVRERPFVPGEGMIAKRLWPPGYEPWVRVEQIEPGYRTREVTFRPTKHRS
jgi:hypothetical protein